MPAPTTTLYPSATLYPGAIEEEAGVGAPATSRFMQDILREDEEIMAVIMAVLQSGIIK